MATVALIWDRSLGFTSFAYCESHNKKMKHYELASNTLILFKRSFLPDGAWLLCIPLKLHWAAEVLHSSVFYPDNMALIWVACFSFWSAPLLFLWLSLESCMNGERAQERPHLCFKPEKKGKKFWLSLNAILHREQIFANMPPSFGKSSTQGLSHKHMRLGFHFQVNVKCKHWSASTLKPQAVDVNSSDLLATAQFFPLEIIDFGIEINGKKLSFTN